MFSISSLGPSGLVASGGVRPPLVGSGRVWLVAEPNKNRRPARVVEQLEARALQVLARDASYAAKVARVRRHQARLRGQLSARAWQAYLRLEEAEMARWAYALERVVRWASCSRRRG